jgi:hypothetical protein
MKDKELASVLSLILPLLQQKPWAAVALDIKQILSVPDPKILYKTP